jgi:polyisoprenoid-binding protein YceI
MERRQTTRRRFAWTIPVLAATLAPCAVARAADSPSMVDVRGGTASFDAATNISAFGIHGKSTSLEGRARINRGANGLVIEAIEAGLAVKTLSTGMRLRDEHMRKYVFATADNQVPDLRFTGDKAVCSGSDAQSTCTISGQLAIRGAPRPFSMALKVTRDGSGYRAVGDGTVKLSEYGIPPPSQLGVKTEDEVKLHLDFVARSSAVVGTGGVK